MRGPPGVWIFAASRSSCSAAPSCLLLLLMGNLVTEGNRWDLLAHRPHDACCAVRPRATAQARLQHAAVVLLVILERRIVASHDEVVKGGGAQPAEQAELAVGDQAVVGPGQDGRAVERDTHGGAAERQAQGVV